MKPHNTDSQSHDLQLKYIGHSTTHTPERHVYHIIVAAGSGSRFGGSTPKQFCELAGLPVVAHSIECMRRIDGFKSTILLVLGASHIDLWHELCVKHGIESPTVITGGATRWESVKNAIDTIILSNDSEDRKNAVITVHDGARPLIDSRLVLNVINGVDGHDGSIPVVPTTDSLRYIDSEHKSHPLDRSKVKAVQTPQAFPAEALMSAYRLPYSDKFTDDASVMAAAGLTDINLVEGDPHNIKITHDFDLKVAELLIKR